MARIRPDTTADRLFALCCTYLRQPVGYATEDSTGDPVAEFAPPLTAPEQATLDDLVLLARSGLDIGLARFRQIKADVATIRAYSAITSPSAAQRLAWERAISRVVLVALLRD